MRAENCACLSPVFRSDARLLVLGSMPGRVSLERAQYYAHAQNAFWPLLYGYFGKTPDADYESRLAFAVTHGVALWDSAAACVRAGSLDTAMRAVQINNFEAIFAACPKLRAVACNGAKACALFMKSPCAGRLPVLKMPSTSPAHAAMCREEKAAQWVQAFELLKKE